MPREMSRRGGGADVERQHTLFAGFCFSFSKIFCDCVLVASYMIATAIVRKRLPLYVDRRAICNN